MTMQGRGWRNERHVELTDLATGKPVVVYAGLTPDPHSDNGRLVAALAIDDGPTLLDDGDLLDSFGDLAEALRDSRQAGR